jgi:Fuc2NAc and GlcNAc transferase
MFDVLLACSAFGIALFCTGWFRVFALRNNLLDIPNYRSSHQTPTPRGGGLAIAFAFLLPLCFYVVTDRLIFSQFLAIAAGGTIVAGIGFLDDISHVRVGWRFMGHCLAILLGIFWLDGIPEIQIAGFLMPTGMITNLIAVLFLVWLLNLFNFMDGIDGLAAMETASVTLGAALILFVTSGSNREAWLLILLAASCLGFLYWNWPPARIFMGDTGSGFLGYTTGILMIMTIRSGSLTLLPWLILLASFLVDATVTLSSRIIRGERWYEAHCSHAYQNAARRYKSHRKVTLAILLINIFWLLPLAWLTTVQPNIDWLLTLVALTPLALLVLQQRLLPE